MELNRFNWNHVKDRLRKQIAPGDKDTPKTVVVTEQKTTDKDLIATATYSFKSYFCERKPRMDRRRNADQDKSLLEPTHLAELALLFPVLKSH